MFLKYFFLSVESLNKNSFSRAPSLALIPRLKSRLNKNENYCLFCVFLSTIKSKNPNANIFMGVARNENKLGLGSIESNQKNFFYLRRLFFVVVVTL